MEFAALLQEFTAAVEAGDGTRLAALFAEDGIYHDTFYGEFEGRPAIKAMLEDKFYGDGADFRWDMLAPVSDGTTGYAHWRFSYTGRMPGAEGRRVAVTGMSRFTLKGGLIARYDEMFNAALALVQLDFAPERLARLHRRWAEQLRADPDMDRHVRP